VVSCGQSKVVLIRLGGDLVNRATDAIFGLESLLLISYRSISKASRSKACSKTGSRIAAKSRLRPISTFSYVGQGHKRRKKRRRRKISQKADFLRQPSQRGLPLDRPAALLRNLFGVVPKDHVSFNNLLSRRLIFLAKARYVLMRNHYHLQAETPRANLSRASRSFRRRSEGWFRNLLTCA
jgi:hypothetical protein